MPKSTKPAAKRSKKTSQAPTPLPEWLTETPIETEYRLSMREGGIDTLECQTIELSRREYLFFKVYLAKLRGIVPPASEPEGFKDSGQVLPKLWEELTPEEISAVPEVIHAN